MKLLVVKIGKAFCTIKRDGLLRGGKRVMTAFFALFGKVGKGDILIVTGGVGDSALYRAHHVAEELRLQGFKVSVTVQDNPFLVSYSSKFSVFIFHRTLLTKSIAELIKQVKKQQKELIFETDDLVYDPKFLKFMDYYQKMNSLERKLYENGVGGEIIRDDYVKICTTTTTFLANKLEKEGKKVFIVKNKLSKEDVGWAQDILKKNKSRKSEEIVIGYFSGTISHNKDFATITQALIGILKKYPQVKLLLAGPLDLENSLVKEFGSRIMSTPYVPRMKHFENIAKVDINISPLEKDNPFCEGKSELKFFEAGILKVPTVATATQTFCEAIEDGVDGFVASDTNEWMNKLEELILDEKKRQEMGQKAFEKTLAEYCTENAENEEYYQYLKNRINEVK